MITYNLHKGRRSGRSVLLEAAQALRERSPDLLLCQEVFHTNCDTERQSEILAEHLGLAHSFGPNRFYRRGCHGNATFTSLPVRRAVNIEISQSFFERRGILHTFLELDDSGLEVLNTHFSLTERQRRRQMRTLIASLPQHASAPVIVAGDFNDWRGRLDRLVHRRRHFDNVLRVVAARDRKTFPAARPMLALDRIYTRGFEVLSARVLRGEPWNRLSDHLPIEAELRPLCRPARPGGCG